MTAVEASTFVRVSGTTDKAGLYNLDVFPGRYHIVPGQRVYSAETLSQFEPIAVVLLAVVEAQDLIVPAEVLRTTRDGQLYAGALELIKAARYDAARLDLEVLLMLYPNSAIAPDATYAHADSYYREGTPASLVQAGIAFNDFITFFPTSPLSDHARQRLQDIKQK